MKLGISGFAADGGQSGISQYLMNVIPRLGQLDAAVELLIFIPARDAHLLEDRVAAKNIVTVADWLAHPLASLLWHMIAFPWLLRRHRCDCAFLPAGNRRLGCIYGVPSVATVHDLSQLHVGDKYDPMRMLYIKRVLPLLLARLTRIVAVSVSTQRDLLEKAGVDSARVRVAYNGAELERFRVTDSESAWRQARHFLGTERPFILYTARLEHPGKNHVGLLEALAILKQRGQLTHCMVFAGSRWNGADEIDACITRLGLQNDVIQTGFVPDDILPSLYAAADLFVFPSLYEGFGIPLLEAMSSGTPICAAKVSSIPEVTGDAALLFDPRDPAAMAAQIQRLLNDPEFAGKLIERGHKQAGKFSWDAAAQGVLLQCTEAIAQ